MRQEINLLSKLPRGKRNVNARAEAKTDEIIAISREYGELYFDGPRGSFESRLISCRIFTHLPWRRGRARPAVKRNGIRETP